MIKIINTRYFTSKNGTRKKTVVAITKNGRKIRKTVTIKKRRKSKIQL